jgi:GNAT superfamily N-acetyltransferase
MLYGEPSQPAVADDQENEEPRPEEISLERGNESSSPLDEKHLSSSEKFSGEAEESVLPVKAPFDLEKIRIVEVEDSRFFAEGLFQDAFGHSPPQSPSNYVALYSDPGSQPNFTVIGFIHLERVGEMGLIGGICVDRRWRGKGIGKRLLLSMEEKRKREKAFFVYTDNSKLTSDYGYEALPHSYVMVKWLEPVPEEEKARLADAARDFGPF